MTWDPRTGTFTPGGSAGNALPGVTTSNAGTKAVTVQDLINLGLIDPGVVSGGSTLPRPGTVRGVGLVAAALQDALTSIELNSATLFKKMNGLAGMVIGSGGLAGYDATGAATITIDPATGNVTLSGTITATLGTIGGWTIGATSLTSGTGANTRGVDSGGTNPAFYAGSATPASAPFRVGTNGDTYVDKLTAGSINVSGMTGNYIVTTDGSKNLVSSDPGGVTVGVAAVANAVSASNLTSGTIPGTVLANSSMYIGTTAFALNRASATVAISGISGSPIDMHYLVQIAPGNTGEKFQYSTDDVTYTNIYLRRYDW